jgi:methyltransferase (TIGR00027 family)
MANSGHISHVSDTARWTAFYRATETARPDALFRDPLAERLAGERGRAVADRAPRVNRGGWWLVARTKIIDDAITRSITEGCDRVLNLAAGLDTRPYRMDLPADFTWVEADLAPLLEEKTELLADQTPHCQLTRSAVDLADSRAREDFLNEALTGATKALVLTEGLSMYLEDTDIRALSAAFTRPEIAWWMVDFAFPTLKTTINKQMADLGQNAPFKFAPENGLAYFEDLGWHVVQAESQLVSAHRFHRLPWFMHPLAWMPKPDLRNPGRARSAATALLTRDRFA